MPFRFARSLGAFGVVVLSCLCLAHGSPTGPRTARLDPYLRRAAALARALDTPSTRVRARAQLAALDRIVALDLAARPPAAVVRVAGRPSPRALGPLGARLVSTGVAAALVRVPLHALPELAALPKVRFVESVARIRPRVDISVPLTGAAALHQADPERIGLEDPVTGAGVVYGSIDSGIDIRHPTFLNPDGTTRVEAFWDTCDMSGDPPPGFEGFGGTLYTREDIDAELAGEDRFPHIDDGGHGTMTAGIGAGSGDDGQYVGMAPGASIVVASIFGDAAGNCDNPNVANEFGGGTSVVSEAARFIEATADGRPFVVNMSIGDHLGPHDGTSLLDRDLEAIATAAPGRALVAAAGNEAGGGVHAGALLPADGTIFGLDAMGLFGYDGAVEIWYPGDAEVEVRVRQRDACGAAVATGDDFEADAYYVDNGRDGVDGRNGDHVALVEVYGDIVPAGDDDACAAACDRFTQACGQDPFGEGGACFERCRTAWNADRVDCVATYESDWGPDSNCNGTFYECLPVEFTVELRSTNGSDARVDIYGAGFATQIDGPGPDMTVGEPASSHGVIAAAAFVHRAHMRGGLDAQGALGELTDYSSRGPMRDGRDKPEIAAPAELQTSALADGYDAYGVIVSANGLWQTTSGGTSSASPHVAGAIALLFEAQPDLDLEGIHEALARGAGIDGDTGTPPGDGWGWGKLRIDGAVAALSTIPTDGDGDGFGAASEGGIDCDDTRPDVSPRAAEITDDGIDDDCDGEVDEPLPEGGLFERADPVCADELEPDAGPDAGPSGDAGPADPDAGVDAATGEPDAGTAPPRFHARGGGCGCDVGASAPAGSAGFSLFAILLVALRRRTKR